jgi:hypothetical protein
LAAGIVASIVPLRQPVMTGAANERIRLCADSGGRKDALASTASARWLACLTIELREMEIDALVSKGLLKADARNDRGAVSNAVYEYLDRTLSAGL